MATKESKFETTTCSRCGGGGHYSYCQRYGTICFKCGGTGIVYTARGAAAKRYFETLLSIPAKDVKPGMKVKALVITNGGELGGERWSEVTAVAPNEQGSQYGAAGTYKMVDGVQTIVYEGLTIVSKHMTFCGVDPETLYRVAATAEQKQAAMAKALEYQGTLTKTGKPRVRPAGQPEAAAVL